MLSAIEVYYENGQIIMQEDPPVESKTNVIITFLADDYKPSGGKRMPGGLKGKVSIPDDFNEPLTGLSMEELDEFEKNIEEGCGQINENDWN